MALVQRSFRSVRRAKVFFVQVPHSGWRGDAIQALQAAAPYELGDPTEAFTFLSLYPVYVAGRRISPGIPRPALQQPSIRKSSTIAALCSTNLLARSPT